MYVCCSSKFHREWKTCFVYVHDNGCLSLSCWVLCHIECVLLSIQLVKTDLTKNLSSDISWKHHHQLHMFIYCLCSIHYMYLVTEAGELERLEPRALCALSGVPRGLDSMRGAFCWLTSFWFIRSQTVVLQFDSFHPAWLNGKTVSNGSKQSPC